jgi:hypothetical protein
MPATILVTGHARDFYSIRLMKMLRDEFGYDLRGAKTAVEAVMDGSGRTIELIIPSHRLELYCRRLKEYGALCSVVT